MNWDAVGSAAEVFGAVAVVVSVWYLAIQVRKQTQESKMAATRELAAQYQGSLDLLIQDPDLARIWSIAVQDYLSLPIEDRMRASFYMQRITRVMEAQYLHTQREEMDSKYFESTWAAYFEGLTFPGFQQWWNLSREIFEPGFRAHVDEMMTKASQRGYDSSFKRQRESKL